MNTESLTRHAALRLEERASALITASWATLGIAVAIGLYGVIRQVGGDSPQGCYIAAVALLLPSCAFFAIAQIYALRSHLLHIQAALEPPAEIQTGS